MRPIVLSIAGSDPTAGAGVQADLKTIEATGGYAATVITAITVQNTLGVARTEVLSADLVGDQLRSVLADLPVGRLWGVGKVTQKSLEAVGIRKIKDILAIPTSQLEG